MNMNLFATKRKRRLAGLAALMVVASVLSLAQAAPPVSVKVYGQHVGAKVIYNYRVINTGAESISSVWIGHDNKSDRDVNNDVWELSELPSGWDFYAGIPASSVSTPSGWRAYVITLEESAVHAVAWEVIDDNSPRIAPGQTLTGMSVVLDKADDRYRTGHAHVKFSGQYPISVPLEPDDTISPNLTMTVSPTRLQATAGTLVTVTATLTIQDDYDPAPEIKLESITANEPLSVGDISGATFGTDDRQFQLRDVKVTAGTTGRIYTVTYSATDASGNKATASATVSVK
jgi:hypothetical protein